MKGDEIGPLVDEDRLSPPARDVYRRWRSYGPAKTSRRLLDRLYVRDVGVLLREVGRLQRAGMEPK